MKPDVSRRRFLATASGTALLPQVLAASPEPGRMKAGTAKVDITPDRARYDVEKVLIDPPTVYHPVHARCLTLSDGARRMVFVTYDLNCLDYATPILRERVEKELGIPPAYLVLLATHNHQVPMQTIASNFDYGEWLAERIFDAIKEAIGKEDGPVDLHFGFGHGHWLRASGAAHADYEIQVLRVMKSGRAMALLFNHPTHPVRGPAGWGPSHPGYAMDEVEGKFPGALALYADACGGNQFPVPLPGLKELEACKQRGHDLALEVVRVANGPMEEITGALESQLKLVSLPLAEPLPYRTALELARGIPMDIGLVPPPHPGRPTNWIRALVHHYKEGIPFPKTTSDMPCSDGGFFVAKLDKPRKYECRFVEALAAKIGNMSLVAIQGEPCTPVGARIKDVLRQKGPAMVFGYFAERNLYIPTREIVRENAYQAQVIQIQFGSPVGWAPESEDEMVRGVLALYGENYTPTQTIPYSQMK
jgi:hypothetical protein